LIDGVAAVPHGWAERRGMFVLKLRVRSRTRIDGDRFYIMQGYTEYEGYTAQGNIDEQMLFYINSYIGYNYVTGMQNGRVSEVERIFETASVLHRSHSGGGEVTWALRPEDVFGSLQLDSLYSGHATATLHDTRSMIRGDTALRANSVVSTPTNYLSRMLDSFLTARARDDQEGFYSDHRTSWDQPLAGASEKPLETNPFISYISDIGGYKSTNVFCFSDLLRLGRNVDDNTTIIRPSSRPLPFERYDRGQGNSLDNSMRETMTATLIAQAMPGLLMSAYISSITIISSNEDTPSPETRILDVQSFVSADIRGHLRALLDKLERELFYDITFGFEETYYFEVVCDIFRDTHVIVSHNGRNTEEYRFPTFTSGTYSSLTTNSRDRLLELSGDIDTLMDGVELPNNVRGPSLPTGF
jgi:hypothetical protein